MTLDALVEAITQKLRSEPQPIVSDKDVNSLENLKAKVDANDEGSPAAMEDLQMFAYGCVLEAVWRLWWLELLKKEPYT